MTVGSKFNSGIPVIIKNSNNNIKINFVKGLIDTDGTLTFKRRYRNFHYYPTIALASKSRVLIADVNVILKALGFETSVKYDMSFYDKRTRLFYTRSYAELNGVDNLNLWIDNIGFNSEKHITKYKIWKKYGFCPANTNINQRLGLLDGKIEILSFYNRKAL